MLRRVENVSIAHMPGFWTTKGPVTLTIGRRAYSLGKLTRQIFNQRQQSQLHYPLLTATVGGRRYWQYENKFYWEHDGLTADQVYALIVTKQQRSRQYIERAQATVVIGSTPRNSASRRPIPDDVKQYVWVRDGGMCCACGSTVELQYDHIIPLAMGGSSDAGNLQILCGPCNRSKAAGLTVRRFREGQ